MQDLLPKIGLRYGFGTEIRMEKSLGQIEKLVEATNSVLEQMKYSLFINDWNKDFSTEYNGASLFSKNYGADAPLEYNVNPKTNESIVEVARPKSNGKMPKVETKKSREKLLNLIKEIENESRDGISRQPVFSRSQSQLSVPVIFDSPPVKGKFSEDCHLSKVVEPQRGRCEKVKEELKSKILETQEIVDKNFQTARTLTQKILDLRKHEKEMGRTPKLGQKSLVEKHSGEHISKSRENEKEIGRTLKAGKKFVGEKASWKRISKSEENIKRATDFSKSPERREKVQEKGKARKEETKERSDAEKIAVINVKRQEKQHKPGPKLKLQSLPSLNIKGSLQVQKIHHLEILPERVENPSVKHNTGVNILSHEQIENEKTGKMLENAKEGVSFGEDVIECFYCGRLIKVQRRDVNPEEIDKILVNCNFNIFDPRIDEFARKCGRGRAIQEEQKTKEVETEVKKVTTRNKKVATEDGAKYCSTKRRFKLHELSLELTKKYKKRILKLDDDRLRLDNILHNLFDKVNETKEYFSYRSMQLSSERGKSKAGSLGNLDGSSRRTDHERISSSEKISSFSDLPEKVDLEQRQHNKFIIENFPRKEIPKQSINAKCTGKKKDYGKKGKVKRKKKIVEKSILSPDFKNDEGLFKSKKENCKESEIKNVEVVQKNSSKEQLESPHKSSDKISSDKTNYDCDSDFEEDSLGSEDKEGSFKMEVAKPNLGSEDKEGSFKMEGPLAKPSLESEVKEEIFKIEVAKPEKKESRTMGVKVSSVSGNNSPAKENILEKNHLATNLRQMCDKSDLKSDKVYEAKNSDESRNGSHKISTNQRKASDHVQESTNKKSNDSQLSPSSTSDGNRSSGNKSSPPEIKQNDFHSNSPRKCSSSEIPKNRSLVFSSAEIVTSLKDVLSSLSDRVANTQFLANELTENTRKFSSKRGSRNEEIFRTNLSSEYLRVPMLDVLQSARKDFQSREKSPSVSPGLLSGRGWPGSGRRGGPTKSLKEKKENASDESEYSVVGSEISEAKNSEKIFDLKYSSPSISTKKGSRHYHSSKLRRSLESSCSEGEVSTNELLDSKSRSIGEVLTERQSSNATVD